MSKFKTYKIFSIVDMPDDVRHDIHNWVTDMHNDPYLEWFPELNLYNFTPLNISRHKNITSWLIGNGGQYEDNILIQLED